MEFQSVFKSFHPNNLGEEKQQMLNLNRRLESYLSRVKLLEEENEQLAYEIEAIRHNDQEAQALRRGLEEELQQARLQVDAAWRERVLTELEVEKMNEELQDLELQRQREAQAKVTAKSKLEQSRKELQEEERAQIWLREEVNQLENEMRHLIHAHEEDVAHLETTMVRSRATMPPTLAQRAKQTPELLRVGQEFSQRATRAWQEAAGAYQGQLARLEESLNQARSRLNQVQQEKHESQLELQTLEKELASAQDVRQHLEKSVSHCREEHLQEIQHLQEHLEDLEMEKAELSQQIDHLLQENRGLVQLKVSLGLEVTTYRALLDSEGLRADKPRNVSIRDADWRPHGVQKNYQTQLPASFRPTFPSSVLSTTRTRGTATQIKSTKPATLSETPTFSSKRVDTLKPATLESRYPKSVLDKDDKNFRSQEVHEKVTDAKLLSHSNEQEAPANTLEVEDEEERISVDIEPAEEQMENEFVVSQKVASGLRNEPPLDDEAGLYHFTTQNLTLCSFHEPEEPTCASDELDQVAFEEKSENEDVLQSQAQDVSMTIRHVDKEVEHVQEETSDSETEAMLEPTFESRPSSLDSEYEQVGTIFNQVTDHSTDKDISNDHSVVKRQESSSSVVGTDKKEVEDKLYPDGEEMDTWDSIIERKVNVKSDDEIKTEEPKQHAEPEEDISAKEPENIEALQTDDVASSLMLTQVDEGQDTTLDQGHTVSPDKEEIYEEDSQNVSVSWRMELESDSYAQENTVADTRPLIRYKSDDTDANTQASHIDESESSEGEQDKKMDEAGTGMWSDKSKTFGTMEDLCEEVEEETVDEDYNLGYTHAEDRDVSQGTIVSEHATVVTDRENSEEMLKNVSEERWKKETEEPVGAIIHTDVDYDKQLVTEKVMEQELEKLSTDRYSVHSAQQQIGEEILQMDDKSVEEVNEQAEPEKAKADCSSSSEPGTSENREDVLSTLEQTLDGQVFSEPYAVMHPSNTIAEEVQHKDHKTMDEPEKGGEGEHNVFIAPDADATEGCFGFTEFISRPEIEATEDTKNPEDPDSVVQVKADQINLHDIPAAPEALPIETPKDYQEHVIDDTENFPKFPAETDEWEALEKPIQVLEVREQKKHDQNYENVPELAEDDVITHQEEPFKTTPDSVPIQNDIFIVKDATDRSLHSLFTSDVKNDFWVSSLESGATYKPEWNETVEQTNQNQEFTDNQVWGNLGKPKVVNGNSKSEVDSSGDLGAMKEQEQVHVEVKKVLVHSEESEVEAESWSSGEEPV
ncbi:nestin [Nematolebias whitei]|uniref:nestin n=1 Tax=Nematolebias whitei TaxID=451745 RepID=UPI00189A0D4E|nr:nestin [Nematolebias whitei]